jgi:hypothetical protein
MARHYLLKELKVHGVSVTEVDYVIAFGFEFAVEVNSSTQNERVMYVGFAPNRESLVEVCVEHMPNGDEWVFHAMEATKEWEGAFNEEARNLI